MVEKVEYAAPGRVAMDGLPPGIILAGGRSRRMGGGDKALLALAGRPILAHVIERIRPQVAVLALNANGDPSRFAAFGLEVVGDSVPDFAGPLAGLLAGLDWMARAAPQATHLLTVPSDTPFLPPDLTARLLAAVRSGGGSAVVRSGERRHPVVGLWARGQTEALRAALQTQHLRKVEDWTAGLGATVVSFASEPLDPFFNVNHPDELALASRLLAANP